MRDKWINGYRGASQSYKTSPSENICDNKKGESFKVYIQLAGTYPKVIYLIPFIACTRVRLTAFPNPPPVRYRLKGPTVAVLERRFVSESWLVRNLGKICWLGKSHEVTPWDFEDGMSLIILRFHFFCCCCVLASRLPHENLNLYYLMFASE